MPELINWSQDFEICDLVDKQHKKLIELLNQLYTAFLQNQSHQILLDIITELKKYTIYHFKTEEAIFDKFGFVFSREHKNEHKFFTEKILEFAEKYNKNPHALTTELLDFLFNWVVNHILISDKKYQSLCEQHKQELHSPEFLEFIKNLENQL